MVRGFSRLVTFLFLGLLRAPTRNSPERVRDTIKKVGNPPVWKPPGLASLKISCDLYWRFWIDFLWLCLSAIPLIFVLLAVQIWRFLACDAGNCASRASRFYAAKVIPYVLFCVTDWGRKNLPIAKNHPKDFPSLLKVWAFLSQNEEFGYQLRIHTKTAWAILRLFTGDSLK